MDLGDLLAKQKHENTNVEINATNDARVRDVAVRDANFKANLDKSSLTGVQAGSAAPLGAAAPVARRAATKLTERIVTGGLGFFLLVLCVVCALRNEPFNANSILLLRLAGAMGAAGFAGLLPGALDLKFSPTMNGVIRAGGALAVFVIVWFWNPPAFFSSP